MTQFRPSGFKILPEVVKNIIIINALFFFGTFLLQGMDVYLEAKLGMFYFDSPHFKPYQILTHVFMHGGIWHIVLNMFALWMFGSTLENVWGPKRFLIYYLITALGAAAFHMGVSAFEVYSITGSIAPDLSGNLVLDNDSMQKLVDIYRTPVIGASGAVFGVLLAFGMLFPNTLVYIYMLFPVKAKYLVIFLGLLELYLGFSNNPGDNVAHFAHLGGMVIGFFLINHWRKNSRNFY